MTSKTRDTLANLYQAHPLVWVRAHISLQTFALYLALLVCIYSFSTESLRIPFINHEAARLGLAIPIFMNALVIEWFSSELAALEKYIYQPKHIIHKVWPLLVTLIFIIIIPLLVNMNGRSHFSHFELLRNQLVSTAMLVSLSIFLRPIYSACIQLFCALIAMLTPTYVDIWYQRFLIPTNVSAFELCFYLGLCGAAILFFTLYRKV
ncbi:MAG: hypothetical protein SPG61_05365 [Arcanobacterium sp.]|nr:hypothetical protein [Arcanobacterium sp.]